ncbi:MAG: class I SAM-dependent methyltransferase [Candidatus Diapherotrites archaeon]|nr:class I SAM-dependent methyltransferase [Candidatus Diapherotrites archaeon]
MMKNDDIEKVKKITRKIEGFLTEREGELLFSLAKDCKGQGVIVEIGSWKGKSTVWLAKGSKRGKKAKVYAIDPHTGSSEHQKQGEKIWTFEEFKKNIEKAKVDDIVVPIVKTSEDAAKDFEEKVGLIFIDGAHEYELVKLDLDIWFPKVIEGGIMAFHDTTCWPGPKKVVEDFVYRSKHFKNVDFIDTITIAQKVEKNSLKDRIRNNYILMLKNLFESVDRIRLPRIMRSLIKRIIKLLH